MKRDFEDKYKDSLPEDNLVSIEDMTDEEFKELLKKRYLVQLSYYKRALMQMTKRPVKEACIYAVSLGQTIFC